MSSFYYYFLIINPSRMIYYGGCDVKWSNYVLNGNTLTGISTSAASKNNCLTPNSDSVVLKPFFDTAKYINYATVEGIPYITFYG